MTSPVQDEQQCISRWIDGLKQGDSQAAEAIWQQYFEKLVRLAKQRLGSLPRRVADEEDVALSALKSVILGARASKFPQLSDRSDLWNLLVFVTTRKATARLRRHFAAKRPDRKTMHNDADDAPWLSEVLGREPSPDFAAQFAEEVRSLLAQLPSDEFRQVALLRMEGYTNREIAAKLDWYEVKVERRLRIIRKHWSAAAEGPDA